MKKYKYKTYNDYLTIQFDTNRPRIPWTLDKVKIRADDIEIIKKYFVGKRCICLGCRHDIEVDDFIKNGFDAIGCIPLATYEIPSIAPYSDKPWGESEKIYAAMVTRMDRDVGRLMDLLKKLGIDHNTIVFFCSDNGAARRWEKRFDSSGPLRGEKRDMYEGGIITPMIVRWPDRIKPDSESDLVWYFADVLPTLAELAATKAPGDIDGISVLPTLLGKEQNLAERFLYWELFERGFQQAVRWKNWKAVRLAPGRNLELYDLSKDIGESDNVATQHPNVIARIETYLKTARSESEVWPTGKLSK